MSNNLSELELRRCEGLAAGYRFETGAPLIVPPSMYEDCKAAGMDMSNIEPTRTLPVWRGPRWRK